MDGEQKQLPGAAARSATVPRISLRSLLSKRAPTKWVMAGLGVFLLSAVVLSLLGYLVCAAVSGDPPVAQRWLDGLGGSKLSKQARDSQEQRFEPPETPEAFRLNLEQNKIRATEASFTNESVKRYTYFNVARLDVTEPNTNPMQTRWVPLRPQEKSTLRDEYTILATMARKSIYVGGIGFVNKKPIVSVADWDNPLIAYHLFRCHDIVHAIVFRKGRSRRALSMYSLRCDPRANRPDP